MLALPVGIIFGGGTVVRAGSPRSQGGRLLPLTEQTALVSCATISDKKAMHSQRVGWRRTQLSLIIPPRSHPFCGFAAAVDNFLLAIDHSLTHQDTSVADDCVQAGAISGIDQVSSQIVTSGQQWVIGVPEQAVS